LTPAVASLSKYNMPTEQVPGVEVPFGINRLVVNTPASIVGAVPKTSAPDPVSPVTADARLALDGVAKNLATPVPRPVNVDGETVNVVTPDTSTT